MLQHFIFSETSPAAPGTSVSSQAVQSSASYLPAGVVGPLDDGGSVDILAQLVGATGGTLDVYMQSSSDNGQTWQDRVHFAQLAAGAAAISYGVTLTAFGQPTSAAPVQIGTGTTPMLSAGTYLQGIGFDRMRLVLVAGTGTTAGAAVKIQLTVQRPRI